MAREVADGWPVAEAEPIQVEEHARGKWRRVANALSMNYVYVHCTSIITCVFGVDYPDRNLCQISYVFSRGSHAGRGRVSWEGLGTGDELKVVIMR